MKQPDVVEKRKLLSGDEVCFLAFKQDSSKYRVMVLLPLSKNVEENFVNFVYPDTRVNSSFDFLYNRVNNVSFEGKDYFCFETDKEKAISVNLFNNFIDSVVNKLENNWKYNQAKKMFDREYLTSYYVGDGDKKVFFHIHSSFSYKPSVQKWLFSLELFVPEAPDKEGSVPFLLRTPDTNFNLLKDKDFYSIVVDGEKYQRETLVERSSDDIKELIQYKEEIEKDTVDMVTKVYNYNLAIDDKVKFLNNNNKQTVDIGKGISVQFEKKFSFNPLKDRLSVSVIFYLPTEADGTVKKELINKPLPTVNADFHKIHQDRETKEIYITENTGQLVHGNTRKIDDLKFGCKLCDTNNLDIQEALKRLDDADRTADKVASGFIKVLKKIYQKNTQASLEER